MNTPSDEVVDLQMVDDTERWLQHRGVPVAEHNISSPFALFGRLIPVLVIVLFAQSITLLALGVYRGWTLYGVFVLSLTGFVWIVVLAWNRRPRRTWQVPAWLAGLGVATIVTLVLALVGMLLVRRETIEQWTELQDSDRNPLVAVTVAGHEYPLTSETILMSILLGVFAAMQFAASIMTDAELQKVYFKGVYDDAREVLAVRARYREYLSRHG